MTSRTKVAIIGTTGIPARYGGFETLAQQLVNNLGEKFDFTVYCSSKYYNKHRHHRLKSYKGSRLVYLPFNANGYQSTLYDACSILHAIIKSDVLLILGISGAILIPFIKYFTKKKIIVNIDGQEWKRGKWNRLAKIFLSISERIAVKYADQIIADNKVIQEYIEFGYQRKNTSLIEYGADHVSKEYLNEDILRKYSFLTKDYAVNVCRIEPENNIHIILDSFARMPNQHLVIVGLWTHNSYGRELKNFYNHFENISLLDAIYSQEELNILRSNASLYIHGHSAGGTNPSLIEAMALGLPIISYDVTYNRETTSHKALYYKNADQLINLVQSIDEIRKKAISNSMEKIANERYTWSRISSLYENLFSTDAVEVGDSEINNEKLVENIFIPKEVTKAA